ncbi:hypothetical protein NKR23_g4991 [Pleurostoma richardsiae]|uniref:DUF7730 domain-containing protein n=1 Tax=Pleurostoma richardsiae TaxID=41990 RepID=A0AA38RI09_9PEZI|nr:hypothetical protein NKR23_g4991 [Pleurostoma richardsiae]
MDASLDDPSTKSSTRDLRDSRIAHAEMAMETTSAGASLLALSLVVREEIYSNIIGPFHALLDPITIDENQLRRKPRQPGVTSAAQATRCLPLLLACRQISHETSMFLSRAYYRVNTFKFTSLSACTPWLAYIGAANAQAITRMVFVLVKLPTFTPSRSSRASGLGATHQWAGFVQSLKLRCPVLRELEIVKADDHPETWGATWLVVGEARDKLRSLRMLRLTVLRKTAETMALAVYPVGR